MTLPDNRFRIPGPLINFPSDVGETGQPHDEYPSPGQPRYDWMRMAIIALLSNQSSYDEPQNFRVGSPWFDLNDMTLKIRTGTGVAGTEWSPVSDVISLGLPGPISLSQWYDSASVALASIRPQSTYSGRAINATNGIPIPESIRSSIYSNTRPFVWVNGSLIDPRDVQIDPGTCPVRINLVNDLKTGDKFTVLLTNIANFVNGDVLAG